jgi:ring-1,2-phenylacetyl-CoA epoxidase subunit PaaD
VVTQVIADELVTARVWEALAHVADPEIPAVSVIDMGMVDEVDVAHGRVRIVVLPTFTGCPAVPQIEADVARVAREVEGVSDVRVETTFDPPWTADRITPEGRARLRDFGLAPPEEGAPVLIAQIGLPGRARCPFCGSRDTRNESIFGPTPCRAVYYCNACRNPFEQFKPV